MNLQERAPLLTSLGFNSLEKLQAYIDLLWAANEELNLISRKMTMEELIDNHVIDCMLPLKSFPKNVRTVADLGSGGGLPGVLYAIQFPEISFHLYEKSPKKQDFLKSCKAIAPNIYLHSEISRDLKGMELVTARAFKPIDVIVEMTRDYFLKGGSYFLLKARREKIDEEMQLAKKKFAKITAQIETLQSPVLEVERHLVLIN